MAVDLRSRWAKLDALARDQADTPEGAQARKLADRILEAFPELGADTPDVTRRLAWKDRHDRNLLGRVLESLGLQDVKRTGYRRKEAGKGVRWRDSYDVTGPPELLDLAAELYEEHRRHLAQLLTWTGIGYAQGAFPLEAKGGGTDPSELDPDVLAAARAAMAAGDARRRPEPDPDPEPRRLTAGPRSLEASSG